MWGKNLQKQKLERKEKEKAGHAQRGQSVERTPKLKEEPDIAWMGEITAKTGENLKDGGKGRGQKAKKKLW